MILKAWGDWPLFQELLAVLRLIGDRHGGVSVANVATRWVLDQPAVGAVIIGEYERTHHTFRAVYSYSLSPQPPHPTPYYVLRIIIAHPPIKRGSTERREPLPYSTGGLSVYLGVRMGIAEHQDDNKRVFRFSLTAQDMADIQAVLARSNGDKLIATIGDCGAEYR